MSSLQALEPRGIQAFGHVDRLAHRDRDSARTGMGITKRSHLIFQAREAA